jgi:hypothetical protein
VGHIWKNGTQAQGRAFYEQYYYQGDLAQGWGASVPQSFEPDMPVLLLVREPVERFISAMTMLKLDFETAMISEDPHFTPQVEWAKSGQPTTCYRMADQLKQFCLAAGILKPFPIENEAIEPKVDLDDHQRDRVIEKYQFDMHLYYKGRIA